jgi:hypothetical protein
LVHFERSVVIIFVAEETAHIDVLWLLLLLLVFLGRSSSGGTAGGSSNWCATSSSWHLDVLLATLLDSVDNVLALDQLEEGV